MKRFLEWKKINEGLIYLFIFLLPTQFGKHFFFDFSYLSGIRIDYLAPTLYVTDIIVVILLLLNVKTVIQTFSNKYFLLFTGLFLINILFSLSKPIAVYRSLKVLEIIVILIIIHKNKLSHKKILLALLLGSALQLLLSSTQFIHKKSIQGIFYLFGERYIHLGMPDIAKASYNGIEILRPYGTFSHPNSLAGFYTLLYFFTLTYKPFEKYFILRQLLLLVSSLLIFITFSKIIIGTYLILNLYFLVNKSKAYNCLLCLVSRVVVLFTLGYIFFIAQGDPLSTTKRLNLLISSASIFMKSPIVGIGQGNYVIAQSVFPIPYSYHFLQPVHNIFVLFLVESGLLITIPAAYILFLWLKKRLTLTHYLFPLLVIILTGLFDHYWLTLQQNALLIPTIFALLDKETEAKV